MTQSNHYRRGEGEGEGGGGGGGWRATEDDKSYDCRKGRWPVCIGQRLS